MYQIIHAREQTKLFK